MNEVCSCLFPAVQWERQMCEAVGGQCLPTIESDQAGVFDAVDPPPLPAVSKMRSCANCGPEIQRHMMVPFGFSEECVDLIENPDRRPYIWELD